MSVSYHAGPGGGDYDPLSGRTFQPDVSAYGAGGNAYTDEMLSRSWGER